MNRLIHLLISAPTGYNTRELLTPLKEHLENDPQIAQVTCVTPAAPAAAEIFPGYSSKFKFVTNPTNETGHTELLVSLKPDLVITPTAGLDDKDTPLLQAAKAVGIRTLTFVASWDNVYKMERFKRLGKSYVLADHVCVWNQMMRHHLKRIFPELATNRVSIVGAPRLDVFSHADSIPSREKLFEYLGIPDDGPLLHIATTELYPMEYIVKTIRQAITAGQLPATTHLYASVHPGGDMHRHQDYADKYNVVVRYSFGRRENTKIKEFMYNPTLEETYLLVALFKYADVLINHSSTTAIESMLADVPVVNIKYGRSLDWWHWRRSMVYRDFQQHYADIVNGGGTDVVTSPSKLVASVTQNLADPSRKSTQRQATIRKMITYTDGSASRRLLDKIKEVALT